MAQFATGTLSSRTTAGDDTIATGFGSAATAFRAWGEGRGAAGVNTFQAIHIYHDGFATAAAQKAISTASKNNVTTTETYRAQSTTQCIYIVDSAGAVGVAATATFNSDGTITVTWSAAPPAAMLIHWAAWQCDAAEILTITSPTSMGSQNYSPSINPSLAFGITIASNLTGGVHETASVGIATTSEQCVCGFSSRHGQGTSITNRVQSASDFIYVPYNDAAFLRGAKTDLSNGNLTINWATVQATGYSVHVLFLQGIDPDIVATTEHTTTSGNRTVSCSVDPEMVMYQGIGAVDASGTLTAINRLSLGAATGAGGHCSWHGDQDNVGTTVTKARDDNAHVYVSAAEATETLQSECEIVSLGTGGWDEHWDTADGSARPYFALAMASPAAPSGGDVNLLRGKFSGKLYGKVA